MAIGLSGAHRVGKSTLAKRISETCEIPYYDGSAGRIMRELGYNSVAQMDLPRRIEAQNAYLERYVDEIGKIREPFVTDRTPLDMAAYMISETGMHADPSHGPAIFEYVDRCIGATDMLFDATILIRPFGKYVAEEGKPQANEAFQWKIQYLIEGFVSDLADCIPYRIRHPDLEDRVNICKGIVAKRLKEMAKAREHYVIH